ncbi:MAG: LacI family DNA-binding transcriptional regulator [Phycisphaerae bacterium]
MAKRDNGNSRPFMRLEDIARSAGVSTATVSYALAGTKGVSAATRRRILKIADELGYVPNRQASGLRAQRSLILGSLIPDIRNPFFADITSGLESSAASLNYRLMLCVTEDDPADEARHLQMLLEHHVDGLVIVPVARSPEGAYPNLKLLKLFQRRHIPIISIVDSINELETGRITTAVYQGTRLLMDHLIGLGHRDIAYFSQPFQRIQKYGRHTAYHDALREAGIPYRPELMVETGLSPAEAYRQTARLLDSGVRFTAAMYPNDYMAVGGLRMFRERGIRVPDDVSVTGFDDIELARYCEIPLTTAAFPIRQLGEMAIRELVSLLGRSDRGGEQPTVDVALRPTLVVRQSTGPPPA